MQDDLKTDDMVYICGKHLVRYNILRKKQNFTIKSLEDERITAMNYFYKNKTSSKIAVALQSRSNILPMVKIYDPLKNITSNLVHSHLDIEVNITGVAIVFRGRYLLSLAEREKGTMYTVSAWTCDQEEFVTSVDIMNEITQMEVSPYSPSKDKAIFSLLGPKYVGIWEFDKIEREIKPVNENVYSDLESGADATCHCWLKDEGGMLGVASGMNIYLFGEDHKLKEKMTYSLPNDVFAKAELEKNPVEHEAILKNAKILSICPRKRGFVIGIGGLPVVAIFMPRAISGFYNSGSYRVRNSQAQSIASISASLDDMYLGLTIISPLTHSQLQTAKEPDDFSMTGLRGEERVNFVLENQGNIEIVAFNFSAVEVSRHQMKDPFENIFEKGVQYQQINGLALCPTKPYLTTVSEDSSLKIWDLNSDDRQKFSYTFHQPPLCIDIHPLSIQIAVGFKDGFRLYFLLEDDIKLAFEYYGRTCTAAKYAESGHLIAVGLSHFVAIYDTYSMKQIRTMTGHNGLLVDFSWISNDRYLLSYCAAGIVRVWNEDGWVQHFEFILGTNKSTRFYSVAYDDEFDYLVLCCSDGKLRIVEEKASNDLMEYDIAPAYFTCVHINKKMKVMFLGTNLGSVRIYLWPILEMKKEHIECVEVAVHQGPIHHIETTFDYSYLVTTSQDGSIYVSKLREFIDGEDISNMDLFNVLSKGKEIEDLGKISNTYNFSPFCLVSNASQLEKTKQIRKMEEKLLDLQSELEEEKEKMCNYYNEYISEKEKENRETLLNHKEKLAVIMEEKDTDLKTLVHNIDNSKQTFEKSLEEMELDYHKKLCNFPFSTFKRNSECH